MLLIFFASRGVFSPASYRNYSTKCPSFKTRNDFTQFQSLIYRFRNGTTLAITLATAKKYSLKKQRSKMKKNISTTQGGKKKDVASKKGTKQNEKTMLRNFFIDALKDIYWA